MQRKAHARGGRRFYQEWEGTTGRGRPTVAALRLPPRPPELRRRVEDAPLPDKQWFVYDSEGKRFGAYMGKHLANNTLQNQTEKTEIDPFLLCLFRRSACVPPIIEVRNLLRERKSSFGSRSTQPRQISSPERPSCLIHVTLRVGGAILSSKAKSQEVVLRPPPSTRPLSHI